MSHALRHLFCLPRAASQPHTSSYSTTALLDASVASRSALTSGSESSKACFLFDIDENSTNPIRVFSTYPGGKGLEVKTQKALCTEIDNEKCMSDPNTDPLQPFLHVTKPIHPGTSRPVILHEDLLAPSVREKYTGKHYIKMPYADVRLPWLVKWKHQLTDCFGTLYIVRRAHYPWLDGINDNSSKFD